MIFGFNPKGMSDQELTEKTAEIHKRLAYSSRFMSDGRLVEQLKSMADACAFEAMERMQQRQFEILNKNKKEETNLTPSVDKEDKTNSAEVTKSSKRENPYRVSRSSRPRS